MNMVFRKTSVYKRFDYDFFQVFKLLYPLRVKELNALF